MTARRRFAVLTAILLLGVGGGLYFAAPLRRNADASKPPAEAIQLPADLNTVSEARVVQAVRQAWDNWKRSPDAANAAALGHVYMAHGWETEATPCYQRAAELEPQDYRWHYYLGRSRMGSQPELAVAALERSTELNANYAPTHLYCALALRKLGKTEQAERAFQKAAALNPDDALTQQGLGELALERKDLDAARTYLLRALSLNPGQNQASAALARLYMMRGDKAAAKQHADEAAKPGQAQGMRDPLWSEVQNAGATADWHAVRGAVLLKQQQFAAALDELEQGITPEQDDARFWLNYGICLLHFQRSRDAAEALQRSLTARPSHRDKKLTPELACEVHTNLGIAVAQGGDLTGAKKSFDAALKIDPLSIAANNNRTILLYKQGKLAEAIQRASAFSAKRPNPETTRILKLLQAEQVKSPQRNP